MPSWFGVGFWNLLERNSPQADRCLLRPTGNPFVIRVSHSLLKISIDSLLWACCQKSQEEKCCGASLGSKGRGGFWMGPGWDRPSWSGCCCSPFPSRAKWGLALGATYLLSCPLPVISLSSTNNYFTLYLTQRMHSLWIKLGCLIWQTPVAAT